MARTIEHVGPGQEVTGKLPEESPDISGSPGGRREAYFPTQQSAPCQDARFSGPHGHSRWPRSAQGSSREGPGAAQRVIGRIRTRAAFARLRAQGVRVRPISPASVPITTSSGRRSLWCSFLAFPDAPPQVAFAIGRTVGSAVERNRLRRRIRAILQEAARTGEMVTGYYLFGAHPSAASLGTEELRHEVLALVRGAATSEGH